MNAPLTIYKASAGSGKTFRLTVEYISLLVQNPENYRHILAVTFTNKATAEMKMRILSQLYGIAKGLKDSRKYLKEVRENVFFKAEEMAGRTKDDLIRERAAAALSLLTHNYSDFRVLTIDAFFQIILRNLARELDLNANLRVSLNDEDIEQEAVDTMVESLRPNDQKLKWITEFIQSNLDENKSWNVIGSIKEFGKNIFKEFYQRHRVELNRLLASEDFYNQFVKVIRLTEEAARASIQKGYQDMIDILKAEGLDDVLLYNGGKTTGALAYMMKYATFNFKNKEAVKRALTATIAKKQAERINDALTWVTQAVAKTPEGMRIIDLANTCLRDMLERAENNRIAQAKIYWSARLTLANLYQLRLLRAIEQAVDDQNTDEGRFLLSNTQQLLHTMIDGSDTPFIFEKIGTRLYHIMIDEFQDTSTLQWENFKVLLDNCLAQKGSHSLIVGDVKQSIYRWRSGDWKLLNNMKESTLVHIEPIRDNWRSSKDIVTFNNTFFMIAKALEASDLKKMEVAQAADLDTAYDEKGTPQIPRKTFPGRVEVHLYKQEGNMKGYNPDNLEAQLSCLAEHVCTLIDHKVPLQEIAILTRNNDEILKIAKYFAHTESLVSRGARLVSDEAFRLDASLSVRLIITALRVVAHPDDKLSKASLVKNYQRYVLGSTLDEYALLQLDQTDTYLPEGFIGCLHTLAKKPLIDLVDHLYQLFSLHRVQGQTAYLCAFHDKLAQYLEDHVASIDELTRYWDEKLYKEKVQADNIDGIRVMTIHKSKGLEFPFVILPFCDWEIEKAGILWCDKPHPTPFNALPIIPISQSKQMLQTVYAEDYKEEHFQTVVDNLNILYVAFTRAERSLFIIGKKCFQKDDETKNANYRSHLIERVLKNLTDLNTKKMPYFLQPELTRLEDTDDEFFFESGQPLLALMPKDEDDEDEEEGKEQETEEEEEETANVFNQEPTEQKIAIETFSPKANFKQSNRSRDFVGCGENATQYVERGRLLHEIFSHIRTLDDVEPTIAQLTLDGIVAADEETLADLRAQIAQCLEQTDAREWFSPRWTLFNECTILTVDPTTGRAVEHRPDRVMKDGDQTVVVDFKFGHPRQEHKEQVGQYAKLLRDMGEKNVRAYLWYVTDASVEEVAPQ